MAKKISKIKYLKLVIKYFIIIMFPLASCIWYLCEAKHSTVSILFALVSSFTSIPLLFGVLLFMFHINMKLITEKFDFNIWIYFGFLAYVGYVLVDCIIAWSTLANLIAWVLEISKRHYGISELTNITNSIYSLYVISTTFLANAYIASFTKRSNQSTPQQKLVRTTIPLRFK
ncbi:hypothetical protein EFN49_06620 [Leuconostoc citreum]|nr:hypothetical protein [Leuconostoc citreum]MCT3056850.1 hypothetical protein [Leuconostoc citreum]MCT3060217.1 hypothetical protein [Leuconostoc citreum]MCT3063136.1 hypothetical protein [Leuconostoc citreum]MCT3070876.1 hypothetical protein [Leuconostoc citreum]